MENTNILIVIETLASEIKLLKFDNDRLRDENASLRTALEAIAKGVSVGECDE